MTRSSLARSEAAPEPGLASTLEPSAEQPVLASMPAEPAQPEAADAPTIGTPAFAGFIAAQSSAKRGGRVRRLTILASIWAHGALLAVGVVASFWQVEELSAPRVAVTFLSLPVAPAPPPPPPARAAEPTATRPRPQRPLRQPVVVPTEVRPPDSSEQADKEDSTAGEAGGTSGGIAGGVVGALSAAPPPRAPELTPQQRQALIRRYLEEILRPRILARFRFPPEAERMGIEGQVLVQASIDGSGRLLGLRPVGSCADEILCEDAARTIREAAPFPPPPPALAEGLKVEVPLVYKLQ